MKKILLMVFCLGIAFSVSAQSNGGNSDTFKKAPKLARKAAKDFEKDGWLITPGALPLEKQFERSYIMRGEREEGNEDYPKYIIAEAMSVGKTFDSAKMQALELSKQNLAGQIQTEVTALVESTLANEQLGDDEAASITETVMASKNLISQSLGRVVPVVEAYREKSNGNKEVYISISYNTKAALESAKRAITKELEKKGGDLHKKLDGILGL